MDKIPPSPVEFDRLLTINFVVEMTGFDDALCCIDLFAGFAREYGMCHVDASKARHRIEIRGKVFQQHARKPKLIQTLYNPTPPTYRPAP